MNDMTHRELAEMIFKNKSIMNGYEPWASDDELIDYYATLIEGHCTKQKLNLPGIGSKRPFEEWFIGLPQRKDGIYEFTYGALCNLVNSYLEQTQAASDSQKGGCARISVLARSAIVAAGIAYNVREVKLCYTY